jgi:hypothetical protein
MVAVSQPIKLNDWSAGLNLRAKPWELPNNALLVASNVVVRNGMLEPLKGLGSAETTGLGAGTWKWIHKLGSTWLATTSNRWAVPVGTDLLAYVTEGVATPKLTNGSTTSDLGLSAPATPPSAAAGAGTGITGTDLTWVITYVDSLGQESAPSPPSTATISPTNDSVDLSSIPTSGTLLRNVYRTDASGVYRFVAQLNAADTTYSDTTPVSELGDPLLTEDASAAPSLTGMAVGKYLDQLGGWDLTTFYRSKPGAPWSWPQGGVDVRGVVAAAATGQGFLILTAERPALLVGAVDDDISQQRLIPYTNTYGCSAAHSICETDRGWVWWSKKGLILFTPGGSFVELMERSFDQADIDGYSTTNMRSVYANGEVLVFHSGGCLRCDLSELESKGPVWTTSDQTADAAHRANDGTVYIGSGNDIKKWGTGSNRTMTVRTREFTAQSDRDRFHVHGAQIRFDGSPTAQWYAAGVAHGSSISVPSNGFLRIAPCAWDRMALELSSASTIYSLTINPEAA